MADEDQVSVRELRANLSALLRRAHEGEVITILRCGRVDAELGPPTERADDDQDDD